MLNKRRTQCVTESMGNYYFFHFGDIYIYMLQRVVTRDYKGKVGFGR